MGPWRRCLGGCATGDLGPVDSNSKEGASFPGGGAMVGALGRGGLSARVYANAPLHYAALSTLALRSIVLFG